jgi:hypothetical protein
VQDYLAGGLILDKVEDFSEWHETINPGVEAWMRVENDSRK